MIISFTVSNFGSIKEAQTLSFEANNSKELESSYVMNTGKKRILKLAMIYGANASGKTTFLKALDFLREMVLEPKSNKNERFEFEPFRFVNSIKNTAQMSLEFICNDIKYLYEVEFSKKIVVSETLYYYSPKRAIVYTRTTDADKEYSHISFGSKFNKVKKNEKKALELNALSNNTVLGAYLKTNIEIKELQEAVKWFQETLKPVVNANSGLGFYIANLIDKNKLNEKDILKILKKADFNICSIAVRNEEVEIPEQLISKLKSDNILSTKELEKIEESGTVTKLDLSFEHLVADGMYSLPVELESQGTHRYFGLAGLLALMMRGSLIFPIDELEASLHPELYRHFLLTFLKNIKNSQLIVTTHNREIFNDRDILRNDAIWFTDKNAEGATELYSLDDFDSSVIRDTTNIFNAYKSGKLSATPNLGDLYLDIENG